MSRLLEISFDIILLNPILAPGLFLCPMQKSENLQFSDFSMGYRKIVVKECLNEEIIGLNLLKKGFHLSCFPMNFANFFRQAILQHTSERPHLEDSLALSETAEPK